MARGDASRSRTQDSQRGILGNAFDIPGITVGTHFGRLVRRWQWTAETDPVRSSSPSGS